MKEYHIFILISYLLILINFCESKEITNIKQAILNEVKKYPKLEIQDLYKLAYQAAMGNEHIMKDTALSRKYLQEEIDAIDTVNNEPLIEYLSSDSTVARVNLKVFKSLKKDTRILFDAMINSAKNFKSSIKLLKCYLNDIEELAAESKIPFNLLEIQKYFQTMEQQNYPVMHHSETYKNLYKPAYRIINTKYLNMK